MNPTKGKPKYDENYLNKILVQGAVIAAEKLVGWRLFTKEEDGSLTGGTIVETEAYCEYDKASHSHKGETKRTKNMFKDAGYLYVCFTYGMHWCLNIVAGKKGVGEAVLIRSIRPESGVNNMMARRKTTNLSVLTNGPAKLTQALGVTGHNNGTIINKSKFLLLPPIKTDFQVFRHKRIGITKDTDRLWRFVMNEQ